MTDAADIDDDDRWLAAEHALGVLEGARRAEAERRAEADPAFRAEVEAWAAHLAPMLLEAPDTAPSPAVWAAIRARLDAEAPFTAPLGRRKRTRPGLWNDVRVWRTATGAALALAAASWLVTVTRAPSPPAAPAAQPHTAMLAASLAPEAGDPLFTVVVDRDRAQVAVVPLHAWEPERARQLWMIPADGVPRSVGLIAPDRPTPLPLPPVMRRQAAARVVFAVSDEPAGGSPLPGPSGPVLATGALEAL